MGTFEGWGDRKRSLSFVVVKFRNIQKQNESIKVKDESEKMSAVQAKMKYNDKIKGK